MEINVHRARGPAQATRRTPSRHESVDPAHVKRVIQYWQRCTPDEIERAASWYDEAQALGSEIAVALGLPLASGCAILAACSINQSWRANITLARRAVTREHLSLGCVDRCVARLKAGEDPERVIGHMPKVAQFWRNIAGIDFGATVDRWMIRAILGDEPRKGGRTIVRYCMRVMQEAARRIIRCSRLLMARLGIEKKRFVCVLQAATWLRVRKEKGVRFV